MKQIILTTMLVAITASSASAHFTNPKHNFHHVKLGFTGSQHSKDETGCAVGKDNCIKL